MNSALLKVLIVVALSQLCVPSDAPAQTSRQDVPPSLSAVKEQLAAGEILYVTDRTGTTTKGKLIGMTDDAIEMRVNRVATIVRAADVSRIQRQQKDSLLNGILIGAAIGSIPGIYWLFADPNECTGLCAEDYAAIGVGVLAGGLIDRAVKKKVTVYDTASGRTKVFVSPLLIHDRAGVRIGLTF